MHSCLLVNMLRIAPLCPLCDPHPPGLGVAAVSDGASRPAAGRGSSAAASGSAAFGAVAPLLCVSAEKKVRWSAWRWGAAAEGLGRTGTAGTKRGGTGRSFAPAR